MKMIEMDVKVQSFLNQMLFIKLGMLPFNFKSQIELKYAKV